MERITTGPVLRQDRESVVTFLRAEGYAQPIQADDRIFAAWAGCEVVAAIRIAVEHDETVLRGMRVRHDLQRRGIGRQLLKALQGVIAPTTCYGIAHRWLTGFYGEIGFEVATANEVPAFLAERHANYLARGLDVVLVVRRATSSAESLAAQPSAAPVGRGHCRLSGRG